MAALDAMPSALSCQEKDPLPMGIMGGKYVGANNGRTGSLASPPPQMRATVVGVNVQLAKFHTIRNALSEISPMNLAFRDVA
jgi:hypothetical protein